MDIPKKYFHDRLVLLLLSVNAFLTLSVIVWVLLQLGGADQGGQYLVGKRENLGLNAFRFGGLQDILALIVFAVAIFGFHSFISIRAYRTRRGIALMVLALATLLLGLTLIVSDLLLR